MDVRFPGRRVLIRRLLIEGHGSFGSGDPYLPVLRHSGRDEHCVRQGWWDS